MSLFLKFYGLNHILINNYATGFYKYFEINSVLKIIKNQIKTVLWTGRRFWKTVGVKT